MSKKKQQPEQQQQQQHHSSPPRSNKHTNVDVPATVEPFSASVRQSVARRSSSSSMTRGNGASENGGGGGGGGGGSHHTTNSSISTSNGNGSAENGNRRTYDKKAYQKSVRWAAFMICLPLGLALLIIYLKDFVLIERTIYIEPETTRAQEPPAASFHDSPINPLEGGRVVVATTFEAVDADCAGVNDAIRSKACRKTLKTKTEYEFSEIMDEYDDYLGEAPVELENCPLWSRECRHRMRLIAHQNNVYDKSKMPPLGSL